MKLAVSTLGCPTWPFEEIVQKCRGYGFQALEIRGVQNAMQPGELTMFDEAHAGQTKLLLQSNGLSLCTLGTSVKFSDPSLEEASRQEAYASVELARRMGIPSLRVFGDKIVVPDSVQRAIHGLRWLTEQAPDIQILLEIHGQFQTIEVLRPIMEAIDAHNFGIVWDVAHSDEVYGDQWQPFYETIAPRIREIHLKDYHRSLGRQGLCLMGEGDIPWNSILQRLRADGFDGYYTLEWEKRWLSYLPEPEIAFPQYVNWMKEREL